MLKLDDKWVWDSWYATSAGQHHVFFLQADRRLIDPEKRHWNAKLGHAVSSDLTNWTVLDDPIAPAGETDLSAPDSQAIWTGSVFFHEGVWYMFYTGISHAEEGRKQRICCAQSTDLVAWRKVSLTGAVEADPRWYEKLEDGVEDLEAWRDPWIHYDAAQDVFFMYVTARGKTGPVDGRGVIGLAQSSNLLDWEVLPPVTEPGRYAEMEVPQLVSIETGYMLVFCTMKHRISAEHLATHPDNAVSGMRYYISSSPSGPFSPLEDDTLLADEAGTFFAARLVEERPGEWRLMAFMNFDDRGEFVGAIGDPIPIQLRADGGVELPETLLISHDSARVS